jgi:gluconolactonase
MSKTYLVLLAALAFACSSPEPPAEPQTANPQSEPVLVAEIGLFNEGIVVDHDGNLDVSHEDQISRISPSGNVSAWASTPTPNGHKVMADGRHILCDREGAVYILDAAGQTLRKIDVPTGANDVTLDGAGGFYFSSPYGSQENPSVGKVYHVDAAGELTIAASGIHYPNGIVLRPDGQALIVGESFANRIWEFPIESPGQLGERRLFAVMPGAETFDPANHLGGPLPDGMAFDTDGNLYVANYGAGAVRVFDTSGALVRSIDTGAQFTSNVAFLGPERNQLYAVGSTGPTQQSTGVVMRIDLPGVTGVKVLPDAP